MQNKLTSEQMRESVRIARKTAGLTQSDLEKKSGVAQSKLSAYESGYIDLSPDELDRLSGVLQAAWPKFPMSLSGFSKMMNSRASLRSARNQPKFLRQLADMSQGELAD